ncbi:DUF3696 domain-containing protein [Elizabethkingia anophelis]|uniref:AAA family ATPase n=1 Tax=Elizabethkingia anophelis TaxID=1117645 RepID=UPI0020B1F0F0|nr:DUF3696 domain-containing protein [Elizabethkingia anophelis]MCT3662505.1 DUF3696 domain-containing protein [Elizabethkingia anophelis]UTF93940.1 DUF3696 domain-containing protein [Elizabethkingia anophelis]
MIDKIEVSNYKIFKNKQIINLKPITILFGKNNTGKSALMKLPVLISESLNGHPIKWSYIINNNSNDIVELGKSFEDLIYNKSNIGTLNLRFENVTHSVSFSYNENENFLELKCNDIFLSNLDRIKGLDDIPESEVFNFNIDFIDSIRVEGEANYYYLKEAFNSIGVKGQNAYQILIEDFLNEKSLINSVSDWYSENFEGWKLDVLENKNVTGNDYEIVIMRNNIPINLKQTGQGIQQVLPLVTRAYLKCDKKTQIIIQEPETHLHPAAHGNLAELFVSSLVDENKKYLIETHSENFILRLRALIANNKLSNDDLGLYYVDYIKEKGESIVREIEIDEFGNIKNNDWPDGVFNETLDEIEKIIEGQSKEVNE